MTYIKSQIHNVYVQNTGLNTFSGKLESNFVSVCVQMLTETSNMVDRPLTLDFVEYLTYSIS